VIAIVLETATPEEDVTRHKLRQLGFREKMVWVKEAAVGATTQLRELGVARYVVVGDTWGRGPE
jgi:hypothetical protein